MSDFTASTLTKLFPDSVERTYQSGQIVVYNGDRPDYVMFLVSGAVKFYDIDQEGNEKIFHICGPGSFLPLFYAFDSKPEVDAFYTTIKKSRFLLLPLSEFDYKIKHDVTFTSAILEWYADEMNHIVLRLKSMERSSARQKLLQALLYLCEEHTTVRPRSTQWARVNFPLSQQMLAELTGLTRETINVTLKDIEKLGITRVPKKMVLEIDRKKLEKVMGESE